MMTSLVVSSPLEVRRFLEEHVVCPARSTAKTGVWCQGGYRTRPIAGLLVNSYFAELRRRGGGCVALVAGPEKTLVVHSLAQAQTTACATTLRTPALCRGAEYNEGRHSSYCSLPPQPSHHSGALFLFWPPSTLVLTLLRLQAMRPTMPLLPVRRQAPYRPQRCRPGLSCMGKRRTCLPRLFPTRDWSLLTPRCRRRRPI